MNIYKILLVMLVMNLTFGLVLTIAYKGLDDIETVEGDYGFDTEPLLLFEEEMGESMDAVAASAEATDEATGWFKAIQEVGNTVVSTLGAFWSFTKFTLKVIYSSMTLTGIELSAGATPIEKMAILLIYIVRMLINIIGVIAIVTQIVIGH